MEWNEGVQMSIVLTTVSYMAIAVPDHHLLGYAFIGIDSYRPLGIFVSQPCMPHGGKGL